MSERKYQTVNLIHAIVLDGTSYTQLTTTDEPNFQRKGWDSIVADGAWVRATRKTKRGPMSVDIPIHNVKSAEPLGQQLREKPTAEIS